MSMPVAILAGGLATRLHPITEKIPKALVDVAGRPFVLYQLEWLRAQGISRVVLLVGYRGEMVRAALGDGTRWGLQLEYVSDGDRLLGTGGALRNALPVLGSAFWVMYGDSYLRCDLAAIEETFISSGRAGLMTVYRNDDRWDRSNVQFEDGRIVRYDKEVRSEAMKHIDYGLGILTARALESYRADRRFDLATVYQTLIDADDLAGFEVHERFYEIGSPEGLAQMRDFIESRS